MSDYKDISYSGPKKDIDPVIGSAKSSFPISTQASVPYHSLSKLKTNLDKITDESNKIILSCKNEMRNVNLQVEKSSKLFQACLAVWSDLSSTEDTSISYEDYLNNKNRKDRSSLFIVEEYEKAVRGVFGNGAIDIHIAVNILMSEVDSIKLFLESYMDDIYDTFDQRIMEILCQWSINGLRHTSRLNSFFYRDQKQYKIPEEELSNITKIEASKYQALFVVKNNTLNQEIKIIINELQSKYLNNSDIFYLKFLGPTLNLRLKSLTNLPYGKNLGDLSSVVSDAMDDSNVNIVTLIKDVSDRSSFFNKKMIDLEERIVLREKYFSHVKQLSSISLKVSQKINKEETNTKTILPENTAVELISDHASIPIHGNEVPHPQYLNKYGDKLSGDLNLDSNVSISGIIPSKHTHNEIDGSSKISGESIISNSMYMDLVDNSESVPQPKNLKNIGYKQGYSRGLLNSILSWNSVDKKYLYEINFTNISNYAIKDSGLNEPVIGDNFIPPFEANAPLFIDWLMDIDNELFFN